MRQSKRYVRRSEIAAAAARAPRVDAKRFGADLEAPRYRAVKSKDHGDPGHFSWIVFDSAKPGPLGEFTYVADCISAEDARLVAGALNAYQPPDVAANAKAAVRAMIARKHRREESRDRKRFVAEAASAEREVQRARTYDVVKAFTTLKPKKRRRRGRG